MRYVCLIMLAILLPAGAHALDAKNVEEVRFVRTSPDDGTAVVKAAGGKMEIVRVGDPVGPNARIVQIGADRVVLEESTEAGPETVIVRLTKGGQRVQRIMRHPEERPVLYAPATVDIRETEK